MTMCYALYSLLKARNILLKRVIYELSVLHVVKMHYLIGFVLSSYTFLKMSSYMKINFEQCTIRNKLKCSSSKPVYCSNACPSSPVTTLKHACKKKNKQNRDTVTKHIIDNVSDDLKNKNWFKRQRTLRNIRLIFRYYRAYHSPITG